MRFSAYNMKDASFVVVGMLTLHVIVTALCVFFCIRFLIHSYDPSVFALLGLLIGGTTLCDVLLARIQGISRFLLRLQVDQIGISCQKLWGNSWVLPWNDIRTFGVLYYNSGYMLIILSKRNFVGKNIDTVMLQHDQIVFQYDAEKWKYMKTYFPRDIQDKLQLSIDMRQQRFYNRKAVY